MADPNKKSPLAGKKMPPRPVFVTYQVLDEDGKTPMSFPKERIRIISASRNAAEALTVMDGGSYPFASYKSVMVSK